MKYRLAVFDLDGTLLDTLDDLRDSLNAALSSQGFPLRSTGEVRAFVGNGIAKLIERGAPAGTDSAVLERLHGEFIGYYKTHCAVRTRPYGGINELLASLAENGVKVAVVSNKDDAAVKYLCSVYFPGLVLESCGALPGVPKKPAPDTVRLVLGHLGVSESEALYIGDSEVDIQTAANSGLDCVSVSWGFRDAETLKAAGASYIAATPAELLEQILHGISCEENEIMTTFN